MIPTIGLEQHSWAYERKMQRREAIRQTINVTVIILILWAVLFAFYKVGYANGAASKPVIEHNTTTIHEPPTLEQATSVLNHFNED